MKSLGLHVIQTPKGRWVFVGSVPAVLAYEGTQEEITKARQFGPALAKVKAVSFATREEAVKAAEALHLEVK